MAGALLLSGGACRGNSYAGIYLFEGGEPGAPLNQLGELYRDMALGLR